MKKKGKQNDVSKKPKTVEQNSSFQRFSRTLVTGVTTGNSPLPPGHIEGRLRWATDIVSPVQLNGHTQTSAPGVGVENWSNIHFIWLL